MLKSLTSFLSFDVYHGTSDHVKLGCLEPTGVVRSRFVIDLPFLKVLENAPLNCNPGCGTRYRGTSLIRKRTHPRTLP